MPDCKTITPEMQRKANQRGYWLADEILDVRLTPMDEDNIACETRRLFGVPERLHLSELPRIPPIKIDRQAIRRALDRLK